MSDRIINSRFFHRFSEKIVPLFTWIIITFPLWMSPFHPAIVAYFIIAFDIYFFWKSLNTAYLSAVSYQQIQRLSKINFTKKIAPLKKASVINHFIIIPNFKEPIYKLEKTIEAIIKNNYPFNNLYLVLAFENREVEAQKKYELLKNKFYSSFKAMFPTYHPLLPHEEPGKASNQTYAAKIISKYCQDNLLDEKITTITICDADSILPSNFFSYLTFEFIKDSERLYHFYWAPVMLYNNFWQLPFFIRIQATLSSILRLAFLSQKENLIQISTYSTNLWLLKQINFWDVDIIPEDWHVYFQAFFTFGEKVKTLPLYTIVNGDAVFSGGVGRTLINRYEQEKRWAWGASDIGYAIKKMFATPHIKFAPKLKKVLYLVETHLFWPTSFFILTLSASIPPLINPVFKKTVLGFLLPQLSGLILTFSSLMLLAYIYVDINIRKKVNVHTKTFSLPLLIVQWYLLPVISFLLSSLPALESHTRLLLGKKLKYKVTEKV